MYEETIDYRGRLILGARAARALWEYLQKHSEISIYVDGEVNGATEGEWTSEPSIISILGFVLPKHEIRIKAPDVSLIDGLKKALKPYILENE